MAASRKLQGEIDRCLKKVTEGVETFHDIWQKVQNATNANQKEKYEADLKKEIKKLQRLRDQIKSWIASAEIKDKSLLMDNRKLIEQQMEKFKVVERETKTKAYSKEGLGAAQKLDPVQKERDEIQKWLKDSISTLSSQCDTLECEIESILANKKKKLDKDKQERVDVNKNRLERHRFHIKKLETLLRMLDNMSVEVPQIKAIKEDVDFYLESSQEIDFEENEYIYDDIVGLDDVELSGVGLPSSATTDSNETGGTPTSIISGSSPIPSPSLSIPLHNHSSDSLNEDKKNAYNKPIKPMAVRASSTTMNSSSNSLLNSSVNSTISTPNNKVNLVSSTPSKQTAREITNPSPVCPVSTAGNFAAVTANNPSSKSTTINAENAPVSVIAINNQAQQVPLSTAITTNAMTVAVTTVHHHQPPTQLLQQPTSIQIQNSNNTNAKISNAMEQHHQQPNNSTNNSSNNSNSNNCSSPISSTVSSRTSPTLNNTIDVIVPNITQPIMNGPVLENKNDGMSSLKKIAQQVLDRAGLDNDQQAVLEVTNKTQNSGKSEAQIPPLLGVAPLGAVPLLKEHQGQFQMMEAAFYHMPHPSDSERVRTYLPRTQFLTPSYYIQSPLPHSDSLEFYQRLGTETLFFVFYYMEGTKAQYLAAKALKKQSWRFHTKYMMWFQRHEEPKVINEEYEQGTYIYFDYEKWGQRKKEGFTFEYKYLEDRDLN
ncbi:CCR4-NOT transcription complex subunit 3 [Onthophagus taurus]|uniref:CCR4-NOT transcription complex subunit 3 n=1 Tax=Onthophagus taurus TaxID=166361 RepID=UPI000C2037CC|nr:CCR4-NOT transcription complex subunit 3 [Onthophagus taurus]XP_022919416.1 CCR4-NOT transcription complex subunit 3 [Onthophagus taurus]